MILHHIRVVLVDAWVMVTASMVASFYKNIAFHVALTLIILNPKNHLLILVLYTKQLSSFWIHFLSVGNNVDGYKPILVLFGIILSCLKTCLTLAISLIKVFILSTCHLLSVVTHKLHHLLR